MNTGAKWLFRILIPLLVVVCAAGIAKKMIEMRPKPQKKEVSEAVTPVEYAAVAAFTDPIVVEAGGTVKPAEIVQLRPQVSGRVVQMADGLEPGGYFKKGDVLLRIEDVDYKIAVEQRKADLERARFEVTNEKGLSAIAQKEWELGDEVETTEEGKELTLRKPQLRRAEAGLKAAEQGLAQAELNLERTTIRAPFNGVIQMENVEIGQVVGPNATVAVLTGSDAYWVQTNVSLDKLAYIQLPDLKGQGGAAALVRHTGAEERVHKKGRVTRLLSDLEPTGRMVRLLVEVQDPLGLRAEDAGLPLLQNAYVNVDLVGKTPANSMGIPASALREGNHVWLINAEERLEIREVSVVWRQKDRVLVNKGLSEGERVITSRIPAPIPGMMLKVADSQTEAVAAGGVE